MTTMLNRPEKTASWSVVGMKQLILDGEPGDIYVSKGKGLIPAIICKILRTPYSHTFVKISDKAIIESNDFGVRQVAVDEFVKRTLHVELVGFPTNNKEQKKDFLGKLYTMLGQKYDYWLLIGDLVSRIFHRSRRHRGLFDHKDKVICSELIANALKQCGIKLPFPTSQMTPEDIYYLCKQNKG